MRHTLGFRITARSLTAGIGSGLCFGAVMINRPVHFDSRQSVTKPISNHQNHDKTSVPSETIRQISSGSVVGFGAGLIIAMFSKTLVLIGGALVATLHMAARFGFDISNVLNRNSWLLQLPFWKIGTEKPWFMASGFLTFILAAFVHL